VSELPPLADDPRFAAALGHLDEGDWLEASDLFEELYFEAVRDELPLVRVLLQISTGMHHISRGQHRAARERLEEGLRCIADVTDARGVDLQKWRERVKQALAER
jgi:predicted metal-dependent hydrolase